MLRLSSARHPQSDGQTERVNQQVECFLRCLSVVIPHNGPSGFPCVSSGTTRIGTQQQEEHHLKSSMGMVHVILGLQLMILFNP